MPASTSSKTSVRRDATSSDRQVFSASAMREISPPDATFSRGLGSSPRFGETRNSTRSAPAADQGAGAISMRKVVRSMASERKLRLHALLQLACGAGAQGGQFARGLLVIARHALALFTELVHALTGVLHLFDLRAHLGQERQHLGDGFAIFALACRAAPGGSRSPPGGRDSPPGPKDSRAGDRKRWIDAAHIVQPFGGQAHLRQRGFGRIVERGVGGAGVLLQAAEVLQDAALGFDRFVLAGGGRGALDLPALEFPEIQQAQLFLLGALQRFEGGSGGLPARVDLRDLGPQFAR